MIQDMAQDNRMDVISMIDGELNSHKINKTKTTTRTVH
jgi:hypothetical protein